MTANESSLFCDICKNRDIDKPAEEYCSQCEEALCGVCRDHHKISKLSKSHQIISIDKHNKLPSFIKQISHKCEVHDCILEFHCKFHDSFCCKLCLISCHKECKEATYINAFITPSSGHQSAALDNIVKDLDDLDSNICSALEDRNRNLTELREQKVMIRRHIKNKRHEITCILDLLEGNLLEKTSAMEKQYCEEIEAVIAKLEDEKKKVNEIQNDLKSLQTFASNIQFAMGTKAYKKIVQTNEIIVQKLYDNGSLNNVTMACMFNEKLTRVIKEIKTFGDVRVASYKRHTSFSWRVDTSAQISKSISYANSVENISVRIVRKINVDCNGITGCAMSEAGNMIFLQAYQNSLLKYGPDGQFHSKSSINPDIDCSYIGFDIAVVDSHTAVVSSGRRYPKHIHFIDIDNGKFLRVFKVSDWCYGLHYHNGSVICCTAWGIEVYDMLSKKIDNLQIMPHRPCTNGTYVTSNEKNIVHANHLDHSVVCYDFKGQVQWTYSDLLLRKPYGITLDTDSNIYVAGFDSNNIVVISPDGKQAKELIGASDGLLNPRAIYFDKTKNLLLVANCDKVAFLFDAHYN